jgi:hypothetical protein
VTQEERVDKMKGEINRGNLRKLSKIEKCELPFERTH